MTRELTTAIAALVFIAGDFSAQQLSADDALAIERVAAEYVAKDLPNGVIGLDDRAFRGRQTFTREASRVDAIARVLKARQVRADSVFTCPGNPSTCRLSVAALVRIDEPIVSPEGARIEVEVRRHSGFDRQPVVRGTKELILSKQRDGTWKVVGVGRISVS